MAVTPAADVVVYICHRSLPAAAPLPHQWKQDGARVVVHEVPCSGKIDGQYLFHAMEGGVRGLCVVACPKGECHLGQGNYRAEIRVCTLQRLLSEIGIEPERAELLHSSPDDAPEQLNESLRAAVRRISALGVSPIRATKQPIEG